MASGKGIPKFQEAADNAAKARDSYAEKLESATDDTAFKYVFLLYLSTLEGYVAETRLHAHHGFRTSRAVAVAGFIILGLGLVGFVLNFWGIGRLQVSYLVSAAGVLIELSSGLFFYLYVRTLQEINRFQDRLADSQQMSLSLLATSSIADEMRRDTSKAEISMLLMSGILRVPEE